jgi:hypothetical protein
MPDHCVKLYLKLSDIRYGTPGERAKLIEFEGALSYAIDAAHAGELDGDDFGQGQCILYTYGSDADALFDAIQPVIRAHPELTAGGYAIKRYGLPENGIREAKVNL